MGERTLWPTGNAAEVLEGDGDPGGGTEAAGMERGDGHRGARPRETERQAGGEVEPESLAW